MPKSLTDTERTQDIRDRMSIDLCKAIEVLLDLMVDQAAGERLTQQRVSQASTASGRLRAHREILAEAIERQ